MAINLAAAIRPTTVTIFAQDPFNQSKALAFILAQSATISTIAAATDTSADQVGMHLTKSIQASTRYTATRSPLEKMYADNLVPEPEVLTVQATLSANPLGRGGLGSSVVAAQVGALGSVIRVDLSLLDRLRKLAARREPLMVVAPPRAYTDMALVGIDETHLGRNKVDVILTFETLKIVPLIPKPSVFDAADVGTYTIENLGSRFPF